MWAFDSFLIILVGLVRIISSEYYCQYISDLEINLNNNDIPEQCKGDWSCWDSQLLDTSRIQLVDMFNSYKERLVAGTLKQGIAAHYSVFKMQYHWYLELLAMWYYINQPNFCNNKNTIDALLLNNALPQLHSHIYKLGNASFGASLEDYKTAGFMVTSFALTNVADQLAAIQRLQAIMMDATEVNQLFDAWDGNQNRIGRADLFGCTLIVRDIEHGEIAYGGPVSRLTRVGVLGCIFAARSDTLKTEPGQASHAACQQACGDPNSNKPLSCVKRELVYDNYSLCEWKGNPPEFKYRRPCQYYYHIENYTFPVCDRYIPSSWSSLKEPDESKIIRVKMPDGNEMVIDTRIKFTTTFGLPHSTRPSPANIKDPDPFVPEQVTWILILVPVIIFVGIFLIVINVLF